MDGEEHRLVGTVERGIVRIGNTVRRPLARNAAFAHALLRHLEQAGFDGAPRFLGMDPQGRETLTFIDGTVGPHVTHGRRIPDAPIAEAARLLRRFHDATEGSALAGTSEVVCHNDWAPANTLFRGRRAVALIDFDMAAPGSRAWDLGYGAFHWLDLGFPQHSRAEQHRRLRLYVSAYGSSDIGVHSVAQAAVVRIGLFADDLDTLGQAENAGWARKCAVWTAEAFGVAPLDGRNPRP